MSNMPDHRRVLHLQRENKDKDTTIAYLRKRIDHLLSEIAENGGHECVDCEIIGFDDGMIECDDGEWRCESCAADWEDKNGERAES